MTHVAWLVVCWDEDGEGEGTAERPYTSRLYRAEADALRQQKRFKRDGWQNAVIVPVRYETKEVDE